MLERAVDVLTRPRRSVDEQQRRIEIEQRLCRERVGERHDELAYRHRIDHAADITAGREADSR